MIDWSNLEIREYTPDEDDPVEVIQGAVLSLFLVCDGARSDDHQGFAAFDVYHGHRIGAIIQNKNEDISPEDVDWIEQHLPYYKKTQLTYINWDKWENYCICAREYFEIVEAEKELQKEKEQEIIAKSIAELIKKVDKLDAINRRKLFLKIPRNQIEKRDYSFLVSLQTYGYAFSVKQTVHVKRFLVKYWELLQEEDR